MLLHSTLFFTMHTSQGRTAVAVLQPARHAYTELVRASLASGFIWNNRGPACADAAVIHVIDGLFARMELENGRTLCVPRRPTPPGREWLECASATGQAIVILTPPSSMLGLPETHADIGTCLKHLFLARSDGQLLGAEVPVIAPLWT
ncbi:hypothetical protein [Streptomyces violascens]|uniref:hypothetical protein n=1 Tax=Streptomyces violascens TaxID=67381 RepID=UPI0036B33701